MAGIVIMLMSLAVIVLCVGWRVMEVLETVKRIEAKLDDPARLKKGKKAAHHG